MKIFLYFMFYIFKVDQIFSFFLSCISQAKVKRYSERYQQKIKFVPQGGFDFEISGPKNNFAIHETSHIKSGTYIECSGGVKIGKYFHCGRGLTIFSSNHNWRSKKLIPYDKVSIKKPVIIGDAVWIGANVTILPGVTINDAAVIAAGSVVVHDVGFGEVVGGNPANVIAKRNVDEAAILLKDSSFF